MHAWLRVYQYIGCINAKCILSLVYRYGKIISTKAIIDQETNLCKGSFALNGLPYSIIVLYMYVFICILTIVNRYFNCSLCICLESLMLNLHNIFDSTATSFVKHCIFVLFWSKFSWQ